MRIPVILLPLLLCIHFSPTWGKEDPVYEAFKDPPKEMRPFVRWWWNGNRISSKETLRQLDLMEAAGIGGVEINSIKMEGYLEGFPGLEAYPALEWLGPEWTQVVLDTVDSVKAREMTADIIVGSGWPFGGRFLPLEEQSQRMRLVKVPLAGPEDFDEAVDKLYADTFLTGVNAYKNRDLVEPNALRVADIRLIGPGYGLSGFDPGIDLMPAQDDPERVKAAIPAGPHTLYIVFHEQGYTEVKQGAPGADGPVVDHYNAKAVSHYLEMMASRLEAATGQEMGDLFRASFVDSLELDHANWTQDYLEQFEARRGYSVEPYLPFVLDPERPVAQPAQAYQEVVRRVRYDYVKTLIELFEERFLATYVNWAESHGLKARIQGYGRETHPLHGSMLPHLPEGETWLWHDSDTNRGVWPHSTKVNKYVSSGAHLSGKRTVSFEAMTNAVPVFRATLNDFKRGMDLSILDGLNHPILHGWNYSPDDFPFPGWIRFGSFVSPLNPFWPEFPRFSDYVGRMGSLLRNSDYQAQVAVLSPRADEWAKHDMLYQPFPEVVEPWYQYRLSRALQKVGFGADYVSERILQKADMKAGALHYGDRSYSILVLQDVISLEPDTARCIQRFHEVGGLVVFVGRRPSRYPGWLHYEQKDAEVAKVMQEIRGAQVLDMVSPPKEQGVPIPGPRGKWLDDSVLIQYAEQIRLFSKIDLPIRILNPDPYVSQVHHELDDGRNVFFVVNLHPTEARQVDVGFSDGASKLSIWDTATGGRSVFGGDRLSLGPLGSVVLVNDSLEVNGTETRYPSDRDRVVAGAASPVQPLESRWEVEFLPAGEGEPFQRVLDTLEDFSLSPDPGLASFGGTLVYRQTFSGDPALGEGTGLFLDLGTVHGSTSVVVNEKELGSAWYGKHVYSLEGALKPGANRIEIRVSTVLANLMRQQFNDTPWRRWAFWFDPIPMGLEGPVMVVTPDS